MQKSTAASPQEVTRRLRFGVGHLLIATAVFAAILALLMLVPRWLAGVISGIAHFSLPAMLLAMVWNSRGPRQVGWAAALLPAIQLSYFSEVIRGFLGIVFFSDSELLRFLLFLTACGLSGLVGWGMACLVGVSKPTLTQNAPPPLPKIDQRDQAP